MNKSLTLAVINKYIQNTWPEIEIVKGEGYFYLYSEDKNIGIKLATLYTTSIYVAEVHHYSLNQWVDAVKDLLEDSYRHQDERCPVYPTVVK